MNNYDYPMGADTSSAPWNQKDNPEMEIEVTVSVTLSKSFTIKVKDYNPCAILRCLSPNIVDIAINECIKRDLKYINITTDDYDMSDICEDDNEYDVIINKFKI